jgi:lysophospholipase
MRRPALFLAMVLLTGCGRTESVNGPFTDSRIPPGLEQRFLPPRGWAWGLIQVGDAPVIRYGVAAPAARPRGDVLIVAGYGESAEDWFETANDLVGRGYGVWIMDPPGQGGSGRAARPRDLGHAPEFASEVAGLAAMTAVIGRPAVLVAQSTAAASALTALSRGLPVKAAVLSAPVLDAAQPPISSGPAAAGAAGFTRAHLGWMRAAGQKPWTATSPLPRGRAGVIAAWQAANPDLRMGGVSYGYIDAFTRQGAALTARRLRRIAIPVLVLRGDRTGGLRRITAACGAIPACVLQAVPGGGGSLHLEADAVYDPWRDAVAAVADHAFAPP